MTRRQYTCRRQPTGSETLDICAHSSPATPSNASLRGDAHTNPYQVRIMHRRRLVSHLWHSFWSVQNAMTGLLGLILAIAFASGIARSSITLSFASVAALLSLGAVVLSTLVFAVHRALQFSDRIVPRVLAARAIGPKDVLLLLEPSPLFSQDTAVSCYVRNDDGFELLAALGTVQTVREDQKIQVLLESFFEGHEDLATDLRNNNAQRIKAILIKPTVPSSNRYYSSSV